MVAFVCVSLSRNSTYCSLLKNTSCAMPSFLIYSDRRHNISPFMVVFFSFSQCDWSFSVLLCFAGNERALSAFSASIALLFTVKSPVCYACAANNPVFLYVPEVSSRNVAVPSFFGAAPSTRIYRRLLFVLTLQAHVWFRRLCVFDPAFASRSTGSDRSTRVL